MSRTSVYIDGGPFLDGIRYQGLPIDLDVMALVRELVPAGGLGAVHFVIAEYPAHPYPTKHRNEQVRFERLRSQGIELHVCRTEVIGSIFVERGVEATMAALIIPDAYSDRFDRALFVSRRPDFVPVVRAVKAAGKAVSLASLRFDLAPANPLAEHADDSILISPAQIRSHADAGGIHAAG